MSERELLGSQAQQRIEPLTTHLSCSPPVQKRFCWWLVARRRYLLSPRGSGPEDGDESDVLDAEEEEDFSEEAVRRLADRSYELYKQARASRTATSLSKKVLTALRSA